MEAQIIQLPKIADPRGNLTFVEGNRHLPFEIARIFYLYDVPGGESRAGHALKPASSLSSLHQDLLMLSCMMDGQKPVITYAGPIMDCIFPHSCGESSTTFRRGQFAVLASQPFEEEGYFRDFEFFLSAVGSRLSQ